MTGVDTTAPTGHPGAVPTHRPAPAGGALYDTTVLTPVRRGRHVTIRPLRPDDYGVLYEIALFTDAGTRWRLHGGVPPFDEFVKLLLQSAPATFAVQANDDGRVLGMVQLWNYNGMNRNGHITAFLDPAVRGRGWPLEGVLLFVEYVFPAFQLRKLYFESLETEVGQYGSIVGPILQVEALYREHQWCFGRLVDCHVLALYAEDVPRLLRLALPTVRPATPAPAPAAPDRPHDGADPGVVVVTAGGDG